MFGCHHRCVNSTRRAVLLGFGWALFAAGHALRIRQFRRRFVAKFPSAHQTINCMRTETIKSIDLFIDHNIKYKHLYSRRDIFSLSEKKTEKNIKIIEIKFKFSETMA